VIRVTRTNHQLNLDVDSLYDILSGGATSVDEILRALNMTEAQLRVALDIPAPLRLNVGLIAVACAKLIEANAKLQEQVARHHAKLTDPKHTNGLVQTSAGMHNAHKRIGELTQRVDALEQFLGDDLAAALHAGSVGGKKAFIRTLRAKGVSDDEIINAFSLIKKNDDELDLDDADMYGELFREFVSFRETTTEDIAGLRKDLTIVEGAHRDLRTDVNTIRTEVTGSSNMGLALGVGALVGFLTFLWAYYDIDFTPRRHTVTIQGRNEHLSNTSTSSAWLGHWGLSIALGLFVACIVAGLITAFGPSKSKSSETVTTTSTTEKKSYRQRWNDRHADRNQAPQPVTEYSSPEQDGEKTDLLPATSEEHYEQKVSH
jgi:hypothetical protein